MSAVSEPVLLLERAGGVATVTLNRPAHLNALSAELRDAIVRAFDEIAADDETRAVILTGAGRAFCAGLDLKELGGETVGGASITGAVGRGANVVRAVEGCPWPVIGAVNGYAITGGFELALACDLLIASTAARFADTHVRIGILPGWGLSQKLSRIIGIGRAKELSLTGNFLDAEQAAAWGLVNRVVEPEALLPACRALAADVLSCVPAVVREYKRVIGDGFATTLREGLEIEAAANRVQAATLTPGQIAARRRGVQDRGRSQSG
jgi:enoyl-CoA hydratase